MSGHDGSAERIAALLFRRVGDSLLATPALRAVKRHLPDAHIIAVCERQVKRVFSHNPSIAEIVEVNTSASLFELGSALRRIRPTVILDFLSDPRSGLASLVSGARRRVGIRRRGRGWMYSDLVARQDTAHPVYSAVHKLALAAAIGADERDTSTEFHLSESDRAFAKSAWQERMWNDSMRVAAFFVHSRREYKRWPLDNFCAIIRRLHDEHFAQPLLLVTPGDQDVVNDVRERTGLSVHHAISLDDLGHLGAVLERCSVLIGNDGGPKHIAVALGIPTVTVFTHDSPVYWTPPDDSRHIALGVRATPDEVGEVVCSILSRSPHEQ